MGVKTTVSGLTYAASHRQAATNVGQNITSLHQEVLLAATELTRTLQALVATMIPGDPNITTLNNQIIALS